MSQRAGCGAERAAARGAATESAQGLRSVLVLLELSMERQHGALTTSLRRKYTATLQRSVLAPLPYPTRRTTTSSRACRATKPVLDKLRLTSPPHGTRTPRPPPLPPPPSPAAACKATMAVERPHGKGVGEM